MKHTNKCVAALLALLLLCFPLAACRKSGGTVTRIAVIVKAVDSDFWHAVKSGVEAAATEYNVSVTFEGPENEEDFEAQNRMIADAVQNRRGCNRPFRDRLRQKCRRRERRRAERHKGHCH